MINNLTKHNIGAERVYSSYNSRLQSVIAEKSRQKFKSSMFSGKIMKRKNTWILAACYLVLTKSCLLSYSFRSSPQWTRSNNNHHNLPQANKPTGQSDVNSFSTKSLFLDCGKLLKTGQYVSAAASAYYETTWNLLQSVNKFRNDSSKHREP